MTAFYFRQGDKPLFGFYHAPDSSPSRAVGIVLCPPQGQEYIRCHRALRILGDLLAQSGFPVLRFDYYGCGDSAGDFSDGDLEQWQRDISAAIEECRARSGRDRIAAVGIRLGASLALLSTDAQAVLDALVLWDPVFDGGQYLRELESLHIERQPLGHQRAPASRRAGQPAEILGFSYSSRLLDQLVALGLGRVGVPDVRRVLLFETTGPDESAPPSPPLGALVGRVDHVAMPGPKIWRERSTRELYGPLVPRAALETIVRWLSDVYAGEYAEVSL